MTRRLLQGDQVPTASAPREEGGREAMSAGISHQPIVGQRKPARPTAKRHEVFSAVAAILLFGSCSVASFDVRAEDKPNLLHPADRDNRHAPAIAEIADDLTETPAHTAVPH